MPSGTAPAGGYKLLIVLPGGDGSEEFRPFVSNMAKQALPPGYIVAQAVAPAWSKSEDRVVWPTEKLKGTPAPKFTTEQFVEEIIADVKAKHAIDAKFVYMLGWSSGGPPCYSMALKQGSPVTGAFVAMSVFKPETLPALDAAKGKAFYIYHSPQDFIRMNFPEAARDKLAAKGARTTLATYEGGHGWHGDVFADIRKGVQWLETNAEKK
jgi:predicted esterase